MNLVTHKLFVGYVQETRRFKDKNVEIKFLFLAIPVKNIRYPHSMLLWYNKCGIVSQLITKYNKKSEKNFNYKNEINLHATCYGMHQ